MLLATVAVTLVGGAWLGRRGRRLGLAAPGPAAGPTLAEVRTRPDEPALAPADLGGTTSARPGLTPADPGLAPADLGLTPADPGLTPADLGAPLGERATLVAFSSAFCQPCRATRRVLADVAGQVAGVAHVEIDAESHLDLVRRLDVRRTPTVLVLDREGRIVRRASGQPRRVDVIAALGFIEPGVVESGVIAPGAVVES